MTLQTNITVEYVIEACYVGFPATTIPPYVDTALWMSLVLVCLVGIPVNLFIIFYDLYGGDPNKRSLGNRFLSIASMMNNVATFFCFMIAILFRYDIGNYWAKVTAFKMYWIAEGSGFILITIYTLYRVTLNIVIRRVIEINEEIMLRTIIISVFGAMIWSMFWLIPGYRFNTIASAASDHQMNVSVFSCQEKHPFTQEKMIQTFVATVFIINAIGVCLLQLGGTRLTPEISQDSNPHITNPMGQRYNSAFLKETSPFCMLLCLVGMVNRTLRPEVGNVEGMVTFWIWIGLVSGIIMPVTFICFVKKDARKYLRRIFNPATLITPIQ